MNTINPNFFNNIESFEAPKILESYPDLDYEMIPFSDRQDNFTPSTELDQLHLKHTTQAKMKELHPETRNVGLDTVAIYGSTLHLSAQSKPDKNFPNEITILLPLTEIKTIQAVKGLTKIHLKDDQMIQTLIDFKTFKNLLKNDYSLDENNKV